MAWKAPRLVSVKWDQRLEWDAVYLIHAADSNIPSDIATRNPQEVEEERRLFYGALTRAKNWLYVCCPVAILPQPRRLW